ALNANRPKNCPSRPGGDNSKSIVLETTRTDPMAMPNIDAAIQNVHIGSGTAATVIAAPRKMEMIKNVFLELSGLLKRQNSSEPAILKPVATMKTTRKSDGLKPTTVVAYGCIIAMAVASASLTKKYAIMKKNIDG